MQEVFSYNYIRRVYTNDMPMGVYSSCPKCSTIISVDNSFEIISFTVSKPLMPEGVLWHINSNDCFLIAKNIYLYAISACYRFSDDVEKSRRVHGGAIILLMRRRLLFI